MKGVVLAACTSTHVTVSLCNLLLVLALQLSGQTTLVNAGSSSSVSVRRGILCYRCGYTSHEADLGILEHLGYESHISCNDPFMLVHNITGTGIDIRQNCTSCVKTAQHFTDGAIFLYRDCKREASAVSDSERSSSGDEGSSNSCYVNADSMGNDIVHCTCNKNLCNTAATPTTGSAQWGKRLWTLLHYAVTALLLAMPPTILSTRLT